MLSRFQFIVCFTCLIIVPYFIESKHHYDEDPSESLKKHEVNLETLISNLLAQNQNQNQPIPNRDKKSYPNDDDQPLVNHGRKSYFERDNSQSGCQSASGQSKMYAESNIMIDSKTSVKNGAIFLQVEKIELSTAKGSLTELHDGCMKACCLNEDGCDTSLLSLKLGEVNLKEFIFYTILSIELHFVSLSLYFQSKKNVIFPALGRLQMLLV
jgi:hypothetical protein